MSRRSLIWGPFVVMTISRRQLFALFPVRGELYQHLYLSRTRRDRASLLLIRQEVTRGEDLFLFSPKKSFHYSFIGLESRVRS